MKAIDLPEKNQRTPFNSIRAAHVGLRTADYDASIQWYTEKLDFRLIKRFSNGALKLAFLAPANDDHFWIEILSGGITGDHRDPSLPIISGFQHLCLAVDDVDATLAEVTRRSVKVVREPFDVPSIGKRCGFIADLFGNVIEFMQDLK